jgi:hypothetical protein
MRVRPYHQSDAAEVCRLCRAAILAALPAAVLQVLVDPLFLALVGVASAASWYLSAGPGGTLAAAKAACLTAVFAALAVVTWCVVELNEAAATAGLLVAHGKDVFKACAGSETGTSSLSAGVHCWGLGTITAFCLACAVLVALGCLSQIRGGLELVCLVPAKPEHAKTM